MTPAQCRAARALLDLKQPDLAAAAALGLSTVVDFERERRKVSEEAVAGMQAALEAAGVVFVAENGEGAGVRFRKSVATAEEVTERIVLLEAKAASIPPAAAPSPESGMNIMKKALVENELTKLRNTRRRLRKSPA
jgi:hypothetical protein